MSRTSSLLSLVGCGGRSKAALAVAWTAAMSMCGVSWAQDGADSGALRVDERVGVRQLLTAVNADERVWDVDAGTLAMTVGGRMVMPGPDGGEIVVDVVDVVSTCAEGVTVVGVLAGEVDSRVVLARRMGAEGVVLAGQVYSPRRGMFEVLSAARGGEDAGVVGGGQHVVRRVTETGVCGATHEHEVAAEGAVVRGDRGPGPTVITVMFVYTEQARTGRGGQAQMDALIDTIVAQANAAYTTSGANVRIIEARRALLPGYVEAGDTGTDLGRLRSTTDGIMDQVHCLRNAWGADVVAMLTDTAASGICGTGYIMTSVGAGFAASAFSVTRTSCVSNFSTTHEMGHNMGCAHDRANAGSASHTFAYGFRTPDNVYRTVMAYAPGTRVGIFSNPDVIFQGRAMGNPLAAAEPTHNAMAITLNAPTMAAFRPDTALRIADINRDGLAGTQDIFDFLAFWFAANTRADVNLSGGVSVEDIFFFLTSWFGAVPAAC